MCVGVVGPADAAEVGHPARDGHVAQVAAAVDEGGVGEQGREQAEIHVIVGHLVHDAIRPAAVQLMQARRGAARPAAGARPRRGAATQSSGALGPAQRGGDRLERCRASRSSPAPWMRGWLASTCSISVVPDRGRPKTKTGRLVSNPSAGGPCEEVAVERPQQAVDEMLVLGRRVVAPAPRQLQRQGVGLAQAVGGAVVVARASRTWARPNRSRARRPGASCGIGQPRFQGGEVGVGQLAAQQRRQPGVGQGEGRLQAQRRAEGGLGLGQVALLLAQPAEVEPGRGRVRLQPCGGLVVPAGLRQPPFLLKRPAELRGAPPLASGSSASTRSQQGIASAGSSRSPCSSARCSQKVALSGSSSTACFSQGRASSSLAFRLQGQPEWAWATARSGSSRRASRYAARASTSRSEAPQGVAEVVVQGRPVGLEPHRFLAVRQRLFRLAAVEQHLAEVRPGRSDGRLQLDGAAEVLERLVRLGRVRGGRCPGCCGRRRKSGRSSQARAERLDGLARGVPVPAGPGPGCTGLRDSPASSRRAARQQPAGPLELAQGAVGLGQVGVERRDVRPQGHRPADQLDGPAVIALLMVQHAEQVQGVGVLRLAGQHFLIQRGGRTQPARLMQLDGG